MEKNVYVVQKIIDICNILYFSFHSEYWISESSILKPNRIAIMKNDLLNYWWMKCVFCENYIKVFCAVICSYIKRFKGIELIGNLKNDKGSNRTELKNFFFKDH